MEENGVGLPSHNMVVKIVTHLHLNTQNFLGCFTSMTTGWAAIGNLGHCLNEDCAIMTISRQQQRHSILDRTSDSLQALVPGTTKTGLGIFRHFFGDGIKSSRLKAKSTERVSFVLVSP